MGRWRHSITAVGWLMGLSAATWALVALARLEWLGIDWSDPIGWLSRTQPETALAEVSRLMGLGAIGWIVLSSLVYLVSVLAGVDPRRLSWMSLGPIRKLVDALVAGSLVIGTLSPTAALAHTTPPPVTAPGFTETTVASGLILPDYVPVPAGPDTDASGSHPPAEETSDQSDSDPNAISVIVERGDNLWDLSQRRIAASGSQTSDADVARYWVRVVNENRSRLLSGDPDLIYPGEVILMPAISPEN